MSEIGNVYSLLRLHEGERLSGYQVNGIWHIGVGHNIENGPPIAAYTSDMILHDDVTYVSSRCAHLSGWDRLSDVRQAVLIDMAFNMGMHNLIAHNPRMLHAVTTGDFAAAAKEMLDGPWKDQVGQRAYRLAKMMESDAWPKEE